MSIILRSIEIKTKVLPELHVEEEAFTIIHCSYWSSFDYINVGRCRCGIKLIYRMNMR